MLRKLLDVHVRVFERILYEKRHPSTSKDERNNSVLKILKLQAIQEIYRKFTITFSSFK